MDSSAPRLGKEPQDGYDIAWLVAAAVAVVVVVVVAAAAAATAADVVTAAVVVVVTVHHCSWHWLIAVRTSQEFVVLYNV